MRALLAALAATLTAPGPYNDAWPPDRYQRDLANIRISFVAPDSPKMAACGTIPRALQTPPFNYRFQGCSNAAGNWIIILNPCLLPRSDDYARILCHELGHMNGWPGDHPAS